MGSPPQDSPLDFSVRRSQTEKDENCNFITPPSKLPTSTTSRFDHHAASSRDPKASNALAMVRPSPYSKPDVSRHGVYSKDVKWNDTYRPNPTHKRCGFCLKVLSNVYNLKRHVERAHGDYLRKKAELMNGKRSAGSLGNNLNPEGASTTATRKRGRPRKDAVQNVVDPKSASPVISQSVVEADLNENRVSPLPPQTFLEAFIPARYHWIQGSFEGLVSEDEFLSDDDNNNTMANTNVNQRKKQISAVKTEKKSAFHKEGESFAAPPQQALPKKVEPPKAPSEPLQASTQNVETLKDPFETSQAAYLSLFGLAPKPRDAVATPAPKTSFKVTKEDYDARRSRLEQAKRQKIGVYFDCLAYKGSDAGRMERTRMKKRAKAEKERVRRLIGKAMRQSDRVLRRKGRDSPVEISSLPSSGMEGEMDGARVKTEVDGVNRPSFVSKPREIVTRQRSRTK